MFGVQLLIQTFRIMIVWCLMLHSWLIASCMLDLYESFKFGEFIFCRSLHIGIRIVTLYLLVQYPSNFIPHGVNHLWFPLNNSLRIFIYIN